MLNPAFKSIVKNIILIIIFALGLNPVLSAQDTAKTNTGNQGYLEKNDIPEIKKGTTIISGHSLTEATPRRKQELTLWQQQARLYRSEGLKLQSINDLDNAIVYYQKAIEIDPEYAIPYNDLGIIYEAKGWNDRAESSYLKAISIDPDYLSPYSNLALLYENEHKLDEAAFFWKKRAELGQPDDPWAQRAMSRFEDIYLVLGKRPDISSREQEILEFMQDVSANLSALKEKEEKEKKEKEVRPYKKVEQDNRQISADYFNKAKQSYEKGDCVTALKEATEAQQLDPSNRKLNAFVDELERRLLSR